MRIGKVRIRNFRSIGDISFVLSDISTIVGANSAGKSNILRAIDYSLSTGHTREKIYENLPAHLRSNQGGPLLSTYVDLDFLDISDEISEATGLARGSTATYSFRAIRSGSVSRKLGDKDLGEDFDFQDFLTIVTVPAIRDLATQGLNPFRTLFAAALQKSRGRENLQQLTTRLGSTIKKRAESVLSYQQEFASLHAGIDGIDVDVSSINLEDVISALPLIVDKSGNQLPLEAIGTGHQSAIIMNFFRQLGEKDRRPTIFLLEEPDNHLHPSTVRTISDDLLDLSKYAQVILTSHSPVLVDQFGLQNLICVTDEGQGTSVRNITYGANDERELRTLLRDYGLRATEPLFSSEVVLVEGPSDALVIARYLEWRWGYSPLHDGVLVLPLGSKGRAQKLCELLNKLDIPWKLILDRDAAWRDADPILLNPVPAEDVAELSELIDRLEVLLNENNGLGRSAKRNLGHLKAEVQNGPAMPTALDGTPLETVLKLTKKLTATDFRDLAKALTLGQKTIFRNLLSKANVWLWSDGAIESAIVATQIGFRVTSDYLRSIGIPAPVEYSSAGRLLLARQLKNKVLTDPIAAERYLDYGLGNDLFAKSEFSRMYSALF